MKKVLNNSSDMGKLIILIGLISIVPLFIIAFYPEEQIYASAFYIPALVSIGLGGLICLIDRIKKNSIVRNYKTIVLSAWLYAILAGALPFVIANKLGIVQSIFESVSGWTTTGLSVMDVSKTPQIFLFHRSFMQYCGGIGFVLMMVAFVRNKNSAALYSTEGHLDQIEASLGKTAKAIFGIYLFLFFAGTVLYNIAGMPIFDSVIHAMSALSTGGFSNKVNSIGEYNSIYIEMITIALMIIGTSNFALIILFVKGKIKQAFKVSELRFMALLLAFFIPIVTLSLVFGICMSAGEAIRHSIFNVVSAMSTTGFSTVSYSNWSGLGIGVLIILMIIGGGSGSTAGGMKLSRVYIALKALFSNFKNRITGNNRVEVLHITKPQGKEIINDKMKSESLGYIGIYFIVFLIGSLLVSVTANCNLTDACFEFASSLGTVGLSLGITNPSTDIATLIIEIIGMLLGRLEIYLVFAGALGIFKKKSVNIKSF